MQAQRLSSDIITTLPQTIIETILCLLPIEEAARTSILAREWRYKWTTIPRLKFNKYTVSKRTNQVLARVYDIWRNTDMRRKLLHAIHQVLLLRQGPIHEFALSMVSVLEKEHTCIEIDKIILHLSSNHAIKKLKLELRGFNVPLSLFSLHQLTDLSLKGCDINLKPIFNGFGSLTSLSLEYVNISKESLLHLLSNCPSLKIFSECELDERGLRYEAPTIMELFERLPMIEHLSLSGSFIEYVVPHGHGQPRVLSTSLAHLKYFCFIHLIFNKSYVWTFLLALIRCSPNLKKIKLMELDLAAYCSYGQDFSFKFEDQSDVWLEHLNELDIKSTSNFKPAMEFVKFVSTRSPNLKKVMLDTWEDKDEELKMLSILLSNYLN